MKINEILLEGTEKYTRPFPQSNDVGGGNIIITHSVDGFNQVDSFSVEYTDKADTTQVKFEYENGKKNKYIFNNGIKSDLEDISSLQDLRNEFAYETGQVMKDNYEKLIKSQDDTEDRTMTHIKRVKYETKNDITESMITNGLKPALDYLDKIISSAEQREIRLKDNLINKKSFPNDK